ncbi:hypothetical protein MAPG_09944 [Magnaporthiopsis poae ATCC 64411]|uniref:Uncharacterized protein n=1 Tax=Magnaporthiopsis poae (strain ATCC 64411 / 73-15) TaxID=644358 RepID=A0A0C4EB97_MAGP6|nr:hypothetical protein MAPG_09944 [Magnaporthiopsis poae ATCC 64411]
MQQMSSKKKSSKQPWRPGAASQPPDGLGIPAATSPGIYLVLQAGGMSPLPQSTGYLPAHCFRYWITTSAVVLSISAPRGYPSTHGPFLGCQDLSAVPSRFTTTLVTRVPRVDGRFVNRKDHSSFPAHNEDPMP